MTHHPPDVHLRPRVLLAEDDHEMRALIVRALQKDGYEVIQCPDGLSLLDHLRGVLEQRAGEAPEQYDLVISDIRMPGITGMSVMEGIRECPESPPVILITAFGDRETHVSAERLGAVALFDKPFPMSDLMACVHQVVAPITAETTSLSKNK